MSLQTQIEAVMDRINRAEAEEAVIESIMCEPPGPTRSSARVHWHKRPQSGPCNESGQRLPETAE